MLVEGEDTLSDRGVPFGVARGVAWGVLWGVFFSLPSTFGRRVRPSQGGR